MGFEVDLQHFFLFRCDFQPEAKILVPSWGYSRLWDNVNSVDYIYVYPSSQ
jgi:hypothetical protein